MKAIYDTDFIVQHLPQKIPFLLVDRVVEHEPGRMIKAIKNVTANETYFQGHFPEKKIMPGVLICETMAQTCALFNILNGLDEHKESQDQGRTPNEHAGAGRTPVLTHINIKFLSLVTPGDQLLICVRPGRDFQGMHSFDVECRVDGRVVTKGRLSTARKAEEK